MGTARTSINYDALVKEDRVHGRVYTDPAIFEEEMDKIFSRGWVYVGHASEIPRPGDFRCTDIGHQSVIMVRGDDGQVRLLMNRCTHRANAVCQAERGNTSIFRCAYHGWTYRNNGDLASVTYQDRYDESLRKQDYGLREVPRIGIYRGFVFGSLSSVGITLDEHLGDKVKEQLDLFIDLSPEGELDVSAGVHKYGYRANWKLQVENSMDGYHGNFVHQRRGLEDRITRLKSGAAYAQDPKSRLSRVVSNVEIEQSTEGELTVYSTFNVTALRRRRMDTFAGRAVHKLRPDGDGFKIAYKKVLLINNDAVINNLTFLI